ncbi:nicotinate-nucleotide adenylyltransferase [Hyphomonas sp.]|uniref:nicotinate-nucleotide adenylyltransferase n=1 Tax=Hyphomonas sp. TaxID=87 RepID=UPI00391DA1B7
MPLPGPARGRGRGLTIGLMGGSFNPAHAGHLHVAETALKRLQLNAVWWIVARGNPLKAEHGSFEARLASARNMAQGRRMRVSDIEARLGLTYTVDTVAALKRAMPGVRFVWIMGADNLRSFHRWRDWERLARAVPVAIIARPGSRISRASLFTRKFAYARICERDAVSLGRRAAPAWVYLRAREHALSSTQLRAGG